MTMASISPSGKEVPLTEALRRRAKVLLPKFCLEAAALRPESPPLIFSRSKVIIYQKMGTEGGPRRAQPTRARPGGPGVPWCLVPTRVAPSGSYFLQYFTYSKNILHKVSASLEMCRIGISDVLFQVQNSSYRYSPSLCKPCIL